MSKVHHRGTGGGRRGGQGWSGCLFSLVSTPSSIKSPKSTEVCLGGWGGEWRRTGEGQSSLSSSHTRHSQSGPCPVWGRTLLHPSLCWNDAETNTKSQWLIQRSARWAIKYAWGRVEDQFHKCKEYKMVYKRQLKTMLFFNGLLQLLKDFFWKMAVYKLMLNQFTPELNIAKFLAANNESIVFQKQGR